MKQPTVQEVISAITENEEVKKLGDGPLDKAAQRILLDAISKAINEKLDLRGI